MLDMDSSVSPAYGDQEGTAHNDHFGCTGYHPLFVFNQFDDLERTTLRSGNVHSADERRSVLEPVVTRYRDRIKRSSRHAILHSGRAGTELSCRQSGADGPHQMGNPLLDA